MKIALVGCAATWKDAPFDDPSYTIWAHASCQPLHLPRVDRWFDLHCVSVWRQGKVWYLPDQTEPATYVEWLGSRTQPVMMQERYAVIPTSEKYPLKDVVEAFGIVPADWVVDQATWWNLVKDRGEFSSTAAYMIALALYEGAKELSLYGIDFWAPASDPIAGLERSYQRPGAKYWVGIARGMGVPVTVAPKSWFQQLPWLYGYQTPQQEQIDVIQARR